MEDFGTFLLKDHVGTKVSVIETARLRNSLLILQDIFQEWLQGKGEQPVTYATLVECLRAANLNVLADDIQFSYHFEAINFYTSLHCYNTLIHIGYIQSYVLIVLASVPVHERVHSSFILPAIDQLVSYHAAYPQCHGETHL